MIHTTYFLLCARPCRIGFVDNRASPIMNVASGAVARLCAKETSSPYYYDLDMSAIELDQDYPRNNYTRRVNIEGNSGLTPFSGGLSP